MWDEKKFFEDFSKETDQINPDEEFIKSLKTMTSEHVTSKRGPVWVRYGVVAAAVVLCTVGGILVRNLNIGKTQPDVQIENRVLHGKTEDQTPVSGTVILTLDAVIGCVKEENTTIIDETGGSIDEEERKQLIHMLEKAGCAKTVYDIGLDEAAVLPSLRLAPYTRRRLSLLRISKMLEIRGE